MNNQEESSAQEAKKMLQVRNELGWRQINDCITWLNPGGLRDSLTLTTTQEVKTMLESRNALGWGMINEFIKWHNPGGLRDSLSFSLIRYDFFIFYRVSSG